MSESAEERKKRRANAEVRVSRAGEAEAEAANAEQAAAYWLRIPVDERAEFVWELSVEAFSLRAER